MLLYLVKSTACMAILFLFYKFLLEAAQMHVFKRYYLIASLIVALVIPGLVFVEYVEPTITTTYSTTELVGEPMVMTASQQPTDLDVINWQLILWTIYGIGFVGFGFRFLKNLFQIIKRIRKNPKLKEQFSIKVLLKEKLPPHTFFYYVFLNKKKFEAQEIPKEVLLHEDVHARQLHSIDVIFVELLQVVFWFNPMVFFFKKCIKLNHEFLADSEVIKETISTSTYQNTLLSYLSKNSQKKYQSIEMANAINYSSIKKRFKIMKTETSKRAVLLRSILVLPLFAFLLFAFSTTKEVIQHTSATDSIDLEDTARSIEITILKDGTYLVDGINSSKDNLVDIVNTLHDDITPETRKKIMNIHITSNEEISREEVWFFYNNLMDYGFHRLVTKEQEVVLSKGNTPFALENGNSISNSSEQKNNQESASRKLMAEYNTLAKKYNEMPRTNMHILGSDVERLKYIYSLMSDKQKADAEPFPDFPEPPPAPDAPNARAEASDRIEEIIKKQDPYDVVGGNIIDNQPNSPKAPRVLNGEVSAVPPPLPPEPLSPLDHVIEMAKKGATFYYEEKEVSSDKAIELLKKNKSLNISTTKSRSKNPKVRISKEPIRLKKSSGAQSAIETGNINVNGEEIFYSRKNGVTSYFNAKGEQVNKKGEKVKNQQKKNPTFYFNGSKISSVKAHELLKNNRSIQVTNEDYSETEYAIVLTDLSKINYTQNQNKNNNPNSLIDLTEMIAQEALFFYNNEPISTERAVWLTKNESIERVQTKGSKTGKPKVYFWNKA